MLINLFVTLNVFIITSEHATMARKKTLLTGRKFEQDQINKFKRRRRDVADRGEKIHMHHTCTCIQRKQS